MKNRWGGLIFLFFILLFFPRGTTAGELRIVLLRISDHAECQGIREALLKSDGIRGIKLHSETSGLVVWVADYTGRPEELMQRLADEFGPRYSAVRKVLPSGMDEITIAKSD